MFSDEEIAEDYAAIATIRHVFPRHTGFIITRASTNAETSQYHKPRGGARVNGGSWTVEERIARVSQMYQFFVEGRSTQQIARWMNISRDSVIRYRKRYRP